jgi:hypothetical protein
VSPKDHETRSFSASNLESETQRLLTEGISVRMDSDEVHDRALFRFLDVNDFAASVRFGERAGLFRRWLELPAVTLEQGVWLLVGRDPYQPKASTPYAPEEFDDLRFRTLIDRLECEITTKKLQPYGQYVPGIARRFRLEELAHTAKRLSFAVGTSAHLLALAAELKVGHTREPPEQTRRTALRAATHLSLVNTLRGESPEIVKAIAPNRREFKRRRTVVTPIDVQLSLPESAYYEKFRALHAQLHPQEPTYDISDSMLEDDRMALNIKFYRGRPRGSKTRPRHER